MRKIAQTLEILDKVASEAETKGLREIAASIDLISNTLESFSFREAFQRGMQIPFDQVDHLEDRLEYLEELLTRLSNTQLVKDTNAEGMFSKLKQMVVSSHGKAAEEGVSTIAKDFRVNSFYNWINSLETKLGKVIPDKYFKDARGEGGNFAEGTGVNRFKSTFEDLGSIFHILDEKLTEGTATPAETLEKKLNRKDTLEDFAKKHLDQEGNEPAKKDWGELDKLFKQASEITGLPRKFVQLRSLVYALKPARVEQPSTLRQSPLAR